MLAGWLEKVIILRSTPVDTVRNLQSAQLLAPIFRSASNIFLFKKHHFVRNAVRRHLPRVCLNLLELSYQDRQEPGLQLNRALGASSGSSEPESIQEGQSSHLPLKNNPCRSHQLPGAAARGLPGRLQAALTPCRARGSASSGQDGRAAAPRDRQASNLAACCASSKRLLQSAGTGKAMLPSPSSALS